LIEVCRIIFEPARSVKCDAELLDSKTKQIFNYYFYTSGI
jgi:hypothetical protein